MERYRIAELATSTGVTPRTIRFYVAEGLLPPPEGAGPAAVYNAAHRDRLRLVGLLKAQYLPLKEIRRRLATLSDAEVAAWLQREERCLTAAETLDSVALTDAAVDYLNQVLGRVAEQPAPYAPPSAPQRAPAIPPPRVRPATTGDGTPGREEWDRIRLAEGVELHVRADRRGEVNPLEALIRTARKLFGEA